MRLRAQMPRVSDNIVLKRPKIVVRAFSTIDLISNWQSCSFSADYQFWA